MVSKYVNNNQLIMMAMKKLVYGLMALAMVGAIVSCECWKDEEPALKEETPTLPVKSPIEMYVTCEHAGWDNHLFSTDSLGDWCAEYDGSFSIEQSVNGETQFILERRNLDYLSDSGIQAFMKFHFYFPANISLEKGVKYYFGKVEEDCDTSDGVVVRDPSSTKKNVVEVRTGLHDLVSTSGWVKFTRIEKLPLDGEKVYVLDMEFECEGSAEYFDELYPFAIVGGKIVDNPGKCSSLVPEDPWMAENAIIEYLLEGCVDFDAEMVVAGLPGVWHRDSYLIYNENWTKITTPIKVAGEDYMEGMATEEYTFAVDGSGECCIMPEDPTIEPFAEVFEWTVDAECGKLALSGDCNVEWTVSGYSNEYIVLDMTDGDNKNYRTILKRKE